MKQKKQKFDLTNKIALVTGAAQGIGKSIAKTLGEFGATVILSDIQAEKGQQTSKELSAADFIACDISDSAQVKSMINAVVEKFGRLDIMVNNAGINSGPKDRANIDEFSEELWHRIINVDLNGTFYCCKAASAVMTKQGSGNIINIASIAGIVALRLQIPFVAAKAAIIKMTEAMACELGPKGIRVNTVSPGSTLVEGTKELFYNNKELSEKLVSFIPQRRPGQTDEIANAVLFLASGAASYVNGHNIVVDGGWICGFNRDF